MGEEPALVISPAVCCVESHPVNDRLEEGSSSPVSVDHLPDVVWFRELCFPYHGSGSKILAPPWVSLWRKYRQCCGCSINDGVTIPTPSFSALQLFIVG